MRDALATQSSADPGPTRPSLTSQLGYHPARPACRPHPPAVSCDNPHVKARPERLQPDGVSEPAREGHGRRYLRHHAFVFRHCRFRHSCCGDLSQVGQPMLDETAGETSRCSARVVAGVLEGGDARLPDDVAGAVVCAGDVQATGERLEIYGMDAEVMTRSESCST